MIIPNCSAYLVDIGNTRVKATPTKQPFAVTAVEHSQLSVLLEEITLAKPTQLLIAAGRSITAQHTLKALQVFAKQHDITVTQLTVRPDWFTINYADPSQFGIDRFLNLLAARARYQTNFCVVSAGTAITLDFFTDHHQGGMILPGLGAAKKLLAEKTGLVDIEKPTELLGNSTATSIGSGLYFGYQNLIVSSINNIQKNYNINHSTYQTVWTGGDAEVLYKSGIIINHLLFEGMLLYLDNIK